MKAIIMAGGEGSRLRPLTCDCPKPMLPLMGRPMMEYAIRLLKRHGICEIGATLGYLPGHIQDTFQDGSAMGVQMRYYIEKLPLGTAGSVKQAQDFLDERFIVLSGDGVTDFDLGAAIAFHESHGGSATLILKKCANPQEYGMVVSDDSGRILSFHEKPGRCDVYSDRINTGIYILEPNLLDKIPSGRPYDFGHDLFPALLEEGIPIYGWTAEGYWCDVGDVAAYLRVHLDAMDGKIRLSGLDDLTGVHAEGALLEPGCKVTAPCFIGKGSRIYSGASIGPGSVIGKNCTIAAGSSIKRSIIFPDCRVNDGAQLRGCIVARGCCIGEGAQLFEESVTGSHCTVGAGAMLPPGVKLWPEKFLPEGEHPEENIVWGSRREQRFISGSLQLETPAQAARAVSACIAELKPRELLLGRNGSTVAAAMWHAAAAGAMAQGVQVIDAGVCSLPQLRHSLAALRADSAMLVEESGIIPLLDSGVRLPERMQRSILKLCERQDFAIPFSGITRAVESAGRTDMPYTSELAAAFRADPTLAPAVVICTQNHHLAELAECAFHRAGLKLRCEWNRENLIPEGNEIGFFLSESGEEALPADHSGTLSDAQRQIACAWTALQHGERQLILPNHATRAIDPIAKEYGAQTRYVRGEPALWMQELTEKSPLQLSLHADGLFFALHFLSALVNSDLSLAQWREGLPAVCQLRRSMAIHAADSARILYAIAKEDARAELGGGIRLQRRGGWAWLGPGDTGNRLEIITEGADTEAAQELCFFYEDKLRRLLHNQD